MSREKIINYILILGLLAFSGFPYFYDMDNHLIVFLIFTFLIWNSRGRRMTSYFVKFFFVFVLIFILQILVFKVIPLYSIIGFFCRVFIGFFVIQSLKIDEFIRIYLRLMVFFCLVSFVVFIPVLIDDSIISIYKQYAFSYVRESFVDNLKSTFFLVNLNFGDVNNIVSRNSGPFWEPGSFGGFLIIAIMLNRIVNKSFYNHTGWVLLLALITTFSSTAYMVLMFVVFYSNFSFSFRNIFLSVVLLFLFVGIYQSIPFLQNKINDQVLKSQSQVQENKRLNRFASFYVDVNDFLDHPITGRGVNSITRYNTIDKDLNNRNNGISDFLVKFGVFGFLLYFKGIYDSLIKLGKFYAEDKKTVLILFYSILFMGFSEHYFVFPFFITLSLLKNSIKR